MYAVLPIRPYTETARHVTENGPGQSAAAGSNRSGKFPNDPCVLVCAMFDLLSGLISFFERCALC
jgi:hypothetical protein